MKPALQSSKSITIFPQKNSNMDQHQFTYRTFLPHETSLLDITSQLYWVLNEKTFLLTSFDLSAAFNTFDHKILLNISSNIEVKEEALTLVHSYLKDQKQCATTDVFFLTEEWLPKMFLKEWNWGHFYIICSWCLSIAFWRKAFRFIMSTQIMMYQSLWDSIGVLHFTDEISEKLS